VENRIESIKQVNSKAPINERNPRGKRRLSSRWWYVSHRIANLLSYPSGTFMFRIIIIITIIPPPARVTAALNSLAEKARSQPSAPTHRQTTTRSNAVRTLSPWGAAAGSRCSCVDSAAAARLLGVAGMISCSGVGAGAGGRRI